MLLIPGYAGRKKRITVTTKRKKILNHLAAILFLIPGLVSAAPEPAANAPASLEPFIGESFSVQVAFDNINAADTGYGPFLDVVLPVTGADGDDGIDIAGSATYLGVSVTTIESAFPDGGGGTGCVDHPFAVDNAGSPLQVCGTTGDKLVTIELPFGSFVPDQPPAALDLNLTLSDLADLGTGLTLYSRAGFRFGATAIDDFATDPSILSDTNADPATWAGQTTVTPRLITLSKSYSGPEDETATGPNFPRQYTITVEVAPGQVVADLDVTDLLPNNMAFLSLVSSSSSAGAGSPIVTPGVGVPANPAGNELRVNFATITGGTPVTVTFEYFIPRLDADSSVIIDAASGDDVISENQARAIGDWTPLDGRDAGATDNAVAEPVGVEHTLEDKSIAIQKSVAIVNDTGNIGEENPGDTLEYTLTFQISDYFSFDDLVVTDVISDGQRFDSGFTPTLTVTRHGSTSAEAPMGVFNFAADGDVDERFTGAVDNPVVPIDGKTLFRFRVSDELAARVDAANDSRLTGGCVPDAGTGTGNPADCALFDQGATTATIKFRTVIQQGFSDTFPSGDASVDQGDKLTNDVTVNGQLLSVENNLTTAGMESETDTSSASVVIAFGDLSKEIYKVNGADPVGNPIQVQPGDTITYRLRYTMPTSDVEELVFIDYLPKPVLNATEVTIFDNTNSGIPAAGHAQFGPADTFGGSHGLFVGVPGVATNAPENSIRFNYDDFDDGDQAAREIDILFTVTVDNEPFADGLFLTNQVRVTQGSTNADDAQADAIIQIQLQEPVLEITKGVSVTSNPNSSIDPTAANLPVDGNLSDADAGDRVTFVITVENQGHAPAHNVQVTDTVPAGLTNCTLDAVRDATGAGLANAGDLFAAGLTLDDPLVANDGTIGAPFGADTALITLSCDVAATVNPLESFDNSATVEWSAAAGAVTPFPSKSDSANVTVAAPTVAKALSTFSPGGASPNVTVGDLLTYTISVTLPEGVTQALTLTDTLPAGFVYQDPSVSVDDDGFAGTLNTPPIAIPAGQTVTIEFGDVTATGSPDTQDNTFTVTLQALVTDLGSNDGLPGTQNKPNRVELDCTTCSTLTATAATRFVEPDLQITKTMSGPVDAGDTISVRLQVENMGNSPAYDIVVTDALNDAGDLFDLSTISEGTTPAGFSYSYTNPTVTYTSDAGVSLAAGSSVTLTFTGTASPDVVTGSSFDNGADVTGDGQDGAVADERSTNDNETGSVNISASTVTKQLISSSEGWTSGANAAIGEILTFQLTFDIPEGVVTEDLVKAILTDQLPAGFQFVAGTALIRTANAVTALNGSTYGDLPNSDTAIAPTVSASPQLLSFDLGSITNSDSDGDTEQIIVTYDVLILNDATNNRSDTKTNTAAINYLNLDGNSQSQDDTHAATIVEPNLSVSKAVLPTTVQGNDTVTFTVTLSNPAGSNVTRVWDLSLTDTLPARYDSGYSLDGAVLSRGNVDISACGGFSGNTLSFDMTCLGSNSRYLEPDDTIVLTYSAVVDTAIGFEEEVTNTVDVTGTSLPGVKGTGDVTPGDSGNSDGERTGTGGGSGGAANDISATNSATVKAGVPTLNKTGDASLAIGDVTAMTLEVDVPVGTTTGFIVTDDLPAGLSYTGTAITIDTPASDFTASNSPNAEPGAGTDPLVFNFGDISNTSASAQRITITYEVAVDNVIANQRGTNLSNTATLTYLGASDPPSDTATVVVLEPDLEIVKTITAGSTGSDGGDSISYQVVVSNSGDSTAYGVDLRDLLPAELLGAPDGTGSGTFFGSITLDNDSGAVVQTGGGAALVAGDAQFATTDNTNDTLTWPAFDLPVGATLTITYDAVLHNSVVAGAVLTSSATAAYTSLTGAQGRSNSDRGDDDDDTALNNYGDTDDVSFTVDSTIGLQKNLNAAHVDNDFTIGDLITFDIRVDLVEGVVNSVEVSDTLSAGLSQVGSVRVVAGAHISYGGAPDLSGLTWDMGAVTNTSDGDDTNDYFVIEVDARVDDDPGNAAGGTLTNGADLTSAAGNAGPDTADVDIVEPNLSVTKTASDTTPSLGDIVTFTVLVGHDTSGADAHDVLVTELIPPGMTYVPGSHSGDGAVDETNQAQPLFDLGAITLADGSKSFTFDVSMNVDATVGAAITNRVNLDYDGQAGDPEVERRYTGNDTEDVTPNADAFIDAAKTLALAVDSGTAGVVDPGDTLEYNITLTNADTPVTGVVFTDPVPAHATYVASSLTSNKGTVDDAANPLRVVVGDMAANEAVTISFQVTVDAGTPSGTLISNQGSVDSDQTVPEPTDEDGIDANGDQPSELPVGGSGGLPADLYTVKSVQWLTDGDASGDITAGDTMRYLLTMENTGGADLTTVTLTDTIPAGLTFVPATESVSGAGNTVSVVGSAVSVSVPSLSVGASLVIEFDVTIDAFAPPTQTYANQADTNSDQTGPDQSDGNGFPGDGNQPTGFSAVSGGPGTPALDLEKRVQLAVDADGDGLTDPGDTLLYVMSLTNSGSADAANVRIQDAVPANTTVVAGSVISSQGIVVSEDPVNINLGILPPSALAVVQFRATVDMGTTDGTLIENQAAATADGGINEPSDDNGLDGDGKNPNLTPVHTHTGVGIPGTPALTKSLIATSEADSAAQKALIGEVLTYRIESTLPAGLLNGVTITDALPAGLGYVANSARLSRTFDTGLLSSDDPGGVNGSASGAFVNLIDGAELQISGGVLTLSLGSVTNSDNDANDETYVLEMQVVVENIPVNQEGVGRSNSAVLSYLDGLGQPRSLTPAGVGVNILEPNLEIRKTATQSTILEEGGNVDFTIVVSNPDRGNSTSAYDVEVADTLPAEFSAMTITNVTPSGGVAWVDNSAGTNLSISVASFPVDAVLTIDLTATLPAGLNRGDVFASTARVSGTSLPGSNGSAGATSGAAGSPTGERTGSGSVNDHVATDSADVTVATVGTIGNYVWHDDDLDGIQDTEEGGVAGITVNLLDAAGNPVAATVTDGRGNYQFTDVITGDYQLEFVPPAGYSFTSLDQGSGPLQDSFDSDADRSTGRSVLFTLGADERNQTIDAGLVLQTGSPASIGDRIWYDANGDGLQDAGEPGMAGVTVRLYDTGLTLIASVVTDGNGSYEFAGLAAGDYIVGFQAPVGYDISPPLQGADTVLDSDADPASGNSAVITLADGAHIRDLDAGMRITGMQPASIGDRVWYDTNGDGVQDPVEPGLVGVNVRLYSSADPATPLAQTTSDTDGGYRFEGLPAGDYIVEFTAPTGNDFSLQGVGGNTTDSDVDPATGRTGIVSLAAGQAESDIDAGLLLPAAPPLVNIGDLVWLDDNHNGAPDAGEGLTGVTVALFDATGSLLATTVTDANGAYRFSDLPVGNYRVEVDTGSLPAELTQIADPDAALDSAADLTGMNADINSADFGYRAAEADLSLAKVAVMATDADDSGSITVGDTLTFTLTLGNAGPDAASGVEVQDTLPDGYASVDGITAGGVLSGDTINWSGINVASGDNLNLAYQAIVQSGGSYTNLAQVSASDQFDFDSTPGNDDGDQSEDDETITITNPGVRKPAGRSKKIPTLSEWAMVVLSLLLAMIGFRRIAGGMR